MSTMSTAPIGNQSRSEEDGVCGDVDSSQIVGFRLSNEEYGVDIMSVQEIILIGQITEMPQVPPAVRGLINLRGNVIPIVDLCVRFHLDRTEETEHSRIIVINVGDRTMGIIVDAVDEVLRIQSDQIEPAPPGICGMGQAYIRGLVKFDNRMLVLLDIDAVLSVESMPLP